MRRFLAKATSPGNLWEGEVIIEAKTLDEAQNKFFEWLKKEPVYSHMWRLNVTLEDIGKNRYLTI